MRTHKCIIGTISAGIILVLFANCGSSKSENETYPLVENPPFKIQDAYYQEWVAGVREGGTGTNVYITLQDITEEVVIEKIYFRNMVSNAQLSPQTRNQYIGYFRNEKNKDVIMDINPVKEAQNTPVEPFPFTLKDDEVVLAYLVGGKTKYTRISNLRMEELLAYPSAKPTDDN